MVDCRERPHDGLVTLEYRDSIEGFRGYVAFDGLDQPLAAGGFRVQQGLTADKVGRLARAMSCKRQLLGLGVNGAKCGIDYDPAAPGRLAAMRRFMHFLRPHLLDRYSMGPDMGTTWRELEDLGQAAGLSSVKGAIARAQGLSDDDFRQRISLLDAPIEGDSLGNRRAGHGLACAAMTSLRWTGGTPAGATVAVQGFGTLGRGAVRTLTEAGLAVIAVADIDGCVHDHAGLDTDALLDRDRLRPGGGPVDPPARIAEFAVDVLVLAACADGLTLSQAHRLPHSVRVVAVGANLGLSAAVEALLADRGITVVPDLVGGCGGPASMAALFGPPSPPTAATVLQGIDVSMSTLVARVLDRATGAGQRPRAAALQLAAAANRRRSRPYPRSDHASVPPGTDLRRAPPRHTAVASSHPPPNPTSDRREGLMSRTADDRSSEPDDRLGSLLPASPAPVPSAPVAAVSGCTHPRAHITDSRFHGAAYSTPTSRAIFCDVCRLQRWLDVEAALALCQADLDIIPVEAAREIARQARIEAFDLDALTEEFGRTSHSLVALLRALERACDGDVGQYVHLGATTQDIQDTAQALECQAVLDAVDDELRATLEVLADLAAAHRDTVTVGRTHARPALPTTFGLKVAGWIDELLRHADRLEATRSRVLVVELFGGVGTMAGFGDRGPELLRRCAQRLGLGVPSVAWHVSRDRVAEFATTLSMVCGTLARIADEIRTLGRPEFDEVEEGWRHGRVGSSTMPHKRNPERCEQVVVLARLARAAASLTVEAMVVENERDSRGLRLEWPAVAEVSHATLAAFALVRDVAGELRVHDRRMAAHAQAEADSLCTEALMLALGQRIGKQRAYGLVYDLCHAGREAGQPLRQMAAACTDVTAHLDRHELERLFDPGQQIGCAGALVDAVLTDFERWRGRTADAVAPDRPAAVRLPDTTQGTVSQPDALHVSLLDDPVAL